MASGAEEKIVRTFESPQMFLDNYARISGDNTAPATGRDGKEKKSLGASVPSLGLSNKPIECQVQFLCNPKTNEKVRK